MRFIASILIMSFFSGWVSIASFAKTSQDAPRELLMIQNMTNQERLPRNFRSTSEGFISERVRKLHRVPSRKGFDTLPISGSAQFSERGLRAIIRHLPRDKNLIVVDLRQESHGFLNGIATSWYGRRGWGNVDKTPEEIHQVETQLLERAWNDKYISLYSDKHQKDQISLVVNSIETEHELVELLGVDYKRFYITDHTKPTDHDVESFIEFVNALPEDAWLHFHCAAGKGRTTTFMAMYDMIKNANHVGFNEIIQRQWLIGGLDLSQIPPQDDWKRPYLIERYQFLEKFYTYVRQSGQVSEITWSQWNKAPFTQSMAHK